MRGRGNRSKGGRGGGRVSGGRNRGGSGRGRGRGASSSRGNHGRGRGRGGHKQQQRRPSSGRPHSQGQQHHDGGGGDAHNTIFVRELPVPRNGKYYSDLETGALRQHFEKHGELKMEPIFIGSSKSGYVTFAKTAALKRALKDKRSFQGLATPSIVMSKMAQRPKKVHPGASPPGDRTNHPPTSYAAAAGGWEDGSGATTSQQGWGSVAAADGGSYEDDDDDYYDDDDDDGGFQGFGAAANVNAGGDKVWTRKALAKQPGAALKPKVAAAAGGTANGDRVWVRKGLGGGSKAGPAQAAPAHSSQGALSSIFSGRRDAKANASAAMQILMGASVPAIPATSSAATRDLRAGLNARAAAFVPPTAFGSTGEFGTASSSSSSSGAFARFNGFSSFGGGAAAGSGNGFSSFGGGAGAAAGVGGGKRRSRDRGKGRNGNDDGGQMPGLIPPPPLANAPPPPRPPTRPRAGSRIDRAALQSRLAQAGAQVQQQQQPVAPRKTTLMPSPSPSPPPPPRQRSRSRALGDEDDAAASSVAAAASFVAAAAAVTTYSEVAAEDVDPSGRFVESDSDDDDAASTREGGYAVNGTCVHMCDAAQYSERTRGGKKETADSMGESRHFLENIADMDPRESMIKVS